MIGNRTIHTWVWFHVCFHERCWAFRSPETHQKKHMSTPLLATTCYTPTFPPILYTPWLSWLHIFEPFFLPLLHPFFPITPQFFAHHGESWMERMHSFHPWFPIIIPAWKFVVLNSWMPFFAMKVLSSVDVWNFNLFLSTIPWPRQQHLVLILHLSVFPWLDQPWWPAHPC